MGTFEVLKPTLLKPTLTVKHSVPVWKTSNGIRVVLMRQIPSKYQKRFGKWMRGQTCIVVCDPETNEVVGGVYLYDWDRWFTKARVGLPTIFD